MTKFERIGVSFQHDARSKAEANLSFKYSCRVCCERGLPINCERCAIASANDLTVAAFDALNTKVNINYVGGKAK